MAHQGAAYLFVPGYRPERFDKANHAAPGMVIVDLEDAVPPEQKDAARDAIAAWLTPGSNVIVRINAEGSPWFEADLRLASRAGVRAVMLPKAESLGTVAGVALANAAVIPLIETARGIAHAREIARQQGVQRLAFGSIDLKVDLGISGDDEALDAFRSELVLASRLAKVQAPIDGVTTAIDDADTLRRDTARARRFGFGAKLCIHPKQVDIVNDAFAPSQAEIAWARRVVDAVAGGAGGAVSVDGKMVDKPVVALAESILGRS
jgi:citrate lyase subunit beta/citryl-CoA lyase